jgi:hypothetical protein
MYLSFPNYEELSSNPNLAKDQEGKVWELLYEKFVKMNNNPNITDEDIQSNLGIYGTTTKFYNTKDYCTVNFAVNFFDCYIVIPVHLYFNQHGKYNRWHSTYMGSKNDLSLMNLLNINHFNDDLSKLEFSLDEDANNKTVYEIIKENYIKTPEYPKIRTTLKYRFDTEHKVYLRGFESKINNSSSNYSMEGFEKFETELMFLKFVKHVITERDSVDSAFINYNDIDFTKSEWMREVHKHFFRSLTGDKRTAFLDYMNVIDMIAI